MKNFGGKDKDGEKIRALSSYYLTPCWLNLVSSINIFIDEHPRQAGLPAQAVEQIDVLGWVTHLESGCSSKLSSSGQFTDFQGLVSTLEFVLGQLFLLLPFIVSCSHNFILS